MRKSLAAVLAPLLVLPLAAPSQAVTHADNLHVAPTTAPWVVSMWLTDPNSYDRQAKDNDGFFCTGSLIDPYTVVTAAHCVYGATSSFVFVQGQDTLNQRGRVLVPRAVKVHPSYSSRYLYNDIAVVELYEPSTIVRFAKLPSKAQSAAALKNKPNIYGWGLDENGKLPGTLRSAWLNDASATAMDFYYDFDPARQVAAGRSKLSGYAGACNGDSGGPLAGSTPAAPGTTYLLGVTSYGDDSGCHNPSPTVFTRISNYVTWINSVKQTMWLERSANDVNVANNLYAGTPQKPLPSVTGLVGNIGYRTTTLTMTTETMAPVSRDIASVEVTSRARAADGQPIEFLIKPRVPWSADGCQWRTDGNTLTVSIGDPVSGLTAYALTYNSFGCTAQAAPMTVNSVVKQVMPGCTANVTSLADGNLLVKASRACLYSPAVTRLRFILGDAQGADIEPGIDTWAGPINLTALGLPTV